MKSAPDGIAAHIHSGLAPIGTIEAGTNAEVAAAEDWLREQGCSHARGPMGPSTWYPYRAVIASSDRPPFLGEPTSSPDVWRARGYTAVAHYASTIASNMEHIDAVAERSSAMMKRGWDIRDLEAHGSFDDALACFHSISSEAFTKAFAYTPLPLASFRQLYAPIEDLLDPRMVLTAFDPDGQAAGFCFTIPDRLNPERREFVIKSLAVRPEHHQEGIGSWLSGVSHSVAHNLGWTAGGIHALMWTGSHSTTISKLTSEPFRQYALFEKKL